MQAANMNGFRPLPNPEKPILPVLSAVWLENAGVRLSLPMSVNPISADNDAMKTKTVEDLLNDQLAACVAATEDCLAHSRLPQDGDKFGHGRRNDVEFVAKLLKASARLTEALGALRGERHQTIRVQRETVGKEGGG
jgi:hypothetical protein